MKRTLRAAVLKPITIPVFPADAVIEIPNNAPPPKRVRWIRTLKEECEETMERIHRTTKCYLALRLVAKVLVHIADGTETSSAGLHSIEMMREVM